MKIDLSSRLRRNAAVLIAASAIGALGIGGVVSAHADSSAPAPSHGSTSDVSDGDGESADETNDDATDTGPDADPNEPGHQDASDATGATE
jgi:hypothetical protein